MASPQSDPRFQEFRDRLENHLRDWNPKLVQAFEKKGTFQQFLDQRVGLAVQQLQHAEANNQELDQDEVEQEMYPEAEKTPEDEELEKVPS